MREGPPEKKLVIIQIFFLNIYYKNMPKSYQPYFYKNNKKRKPKGYMYKKPSVGRQLYKDVSYLKSLVNVEFKSSDITLSESVDTSGFLQLLNGLTRGDTISTRDGRMVNNKSIQISWSAAMHGSATDTIVRCIVFLDKQANGAVATAAELLQDVNIRGLRNLDNRRRFWIISDQIMNLDSQAHSRGIRKFYKQLNVKTIYDDSNNGTIADIETNALYCFWISNEATNTPTVAAEARLRFIDN